MEESKVDDMYIENLEEWIFEEEKIVTYKFLSKSLKVHVNVAKQMLFHFVESKKSIHPNLGVVYLVSGLVKNNSEDEASDPFDQKVMFVKRENLDQILKSFTTILSQHIYSVQQNNSMVSASALYCVDKNNLDQDISSSAGLNSIKHRNAVPREAAKFATIIKKEIKEEPSAKKEPPKKKTGGIQDAFNKTAKKASPEKSQPTKSSVSTTISSKAKSAGGIASMFAKQSSSKAKAKSTEEKENIVNQKIEAGSSGGSKDSSPEKKEEEVKPNKKTSVSGSKSAKSSGKKSSKAEDSKKRKRIQVMSDSEEEEEEEKAAEKDDVRREEEEEAPPVSKLIESDEEEIPATPVRDSQQKPGRRKVKKQVDKTYIDDKG